MFDCVFQLVRFIVPLFKTRRGRQIEDLAPRHHLFVHVSAALRTPSADRPESHLTLSRTLHLKDD
jgi:hypothetical protein